MSTLSEIKIPDIGDVSEAEVIEISVAVGDSIEREDTLIVLETDKATMDVPAPASGVIKEIKCQVGDKVAQDSLIIILESSAAKQEPLTKDEPVTKQEVEISEEVETKKEVLVEEESETKKEPAKLLQQQVKVPDIGDNDSVEVIEISAHPGDVVEKEDPLIVLETEKATMEIPSPFAGKVIDIKVVVGDKVSSGDLIGSIETEAEAEQTAATPATDEEAPEQSQATTTELSKPEVVKSQSASPEPVTNTSGLAHASPGVRRFARELGADINLIKGSGSKGRIVKEDVQKFVKAELSKTNKTGDTATSGLPQLPVIDFSKFGEIESVPLTKIQKISSNNLHRNWVNIPHVTQNDDADITEMEAFRQSMKAEAAAEGIKLTPLAFMMKAVVASLQAYPRFNASLAVDGETLILKKYFNIGVAVDTPDGLVVPVVRDVDKKSVYQLASELAEVSAKARDKKLGIDGMQGGCFTISSLGGIGGTSFSPIVNWPDVAILGVSKSSMKPVWDGQEFKPRLMLPLCLSYDHRVIDGAVAARFITHLSKTLGDIRRLVL